MRRMYELLLTSATATDSHVDIPLYPIHLVSCETFLLPHHVYHTLHSHQRLLPLISIRDIFYGKHNCWVDLLDIQTCKYLTIRIPKSCFECSNQTKRNVFLHYYHHIRDADLFFYLLSCLKTNMNGGEC